MVKMLHSCLWSIVLIAQIDACTGSAGSCYSMTTHVVTCDVAEASCGDYWYAPGYVSARNSCCHCKASCADVSDSCSYYDVVADTSTSSGSMSTTTSSYGCYDVSIHVCACDSSEDKCNAIGHTWTDGCNSCNAAPTAAPATLAPTAAPRAGCYDLTAKACSCSIGESACTSRGDTWTTCTACIDDYDNTSGSASVKPRFLVMALLLLAAAANAWNWLL